MQCFCCYSCFAIVSFCQPMLKADGDIDLKSKYGFSFPANPIWKFATKFHFLFSIIVGEQAFNTIHLNSLFAGRSRFRRQPPVGRILYLISCGFFFLCTFIKQSEYYVITFFLNQIEWDLWMHRLFKCKKREDRIDNILKSKENLFHSKMHGNRLKKKKGNWKAYVKPFITK